MLHQKSTGKEDRNIYDDPLYEGGVGDHPGDVPGVRFIPFERDINSPRVTKLVDKLQQAGKTVQVRWTVAGILLIVSSAVVIKEAMRRRNNKRGSRPKGSARREK